MNSTRVKAFKNELRNYDYYQNQIKTLDAQVEYYYDLLSGVKGVDPSKETFHGEPNKDREYQIRDKIEILIKRKKHLESETKYIDSILDKLPKNIKSATIEIFVYHQKSSKIAKIYNLPQNTLLYRINTSLDKAFN